MNIKIYTSYFYQVRFMRPHMIPLSTAVWDPKWFHNFQGQDHIFLDKNGVVNGLRADPFVPNSSCNDLCRGPEYCATKDSNSCDFLKAYAVQLSKLDINEILERMERIGKKCQILTKTKEEPIFILLVHEAPINLCSERRIIQQYFKRYNIECSEFNPKEEV